MKKAFLILGVCFLLLSSHANANQKESVTLEKKYFDMVYFCIDLPNYISGPYIAVGGQCLGNMDATHHNYILEENEFEDGSGTRFASDTEKYDTFFNLFCNQLDNLKSKEEQIRFSLYKDYLCDTDNAQKKIIDQNKSERAEQKRLEAEIKIAKREAEEDKLTRIFCEGDKTTPQTKILEKDGNCSNGENEISRKRFCEYYTSKSWFKDTRTIKRLCDPSLLIAEEETTLTPISKPEF